MESPLSGKRLWKVASAIRERVLVLQTTRYRNLESQVDGLLSDLDELQRVRRLLALCVTRQWLAASANCAEQVARVTRNLPYLCQETQKTVDAPEPLIPTVRDVLQELLQAEEEFDRICYYPEDNVLSVVTEAIELEGVYLGDFEIQLQIDVIGEPRSRGAYKVVALDPHPSTRNEEVTHPHVSGERLCAGDAGAAIDAAIASGRVCDFFVLVRSVLTNYNPNSPYVALEDWNGQACSDCGSVVSDDNTYFCTTCEEDFCEDCSSYCTYCEETTCLSCLDTCPVCQERACPGCFTTCPDCGRRLCRGCEHDEKCPCHEEEPESEENDDTNSDRPEGAACAGEDGEGSRDCSIADTEQTGDPAGAQAAQEGHPAACAPVLADRLGETPVLPGSR